MKKNIKNLLLLWLIFPLVLITCDSSVQFENGSVDLEESHESLISNSLTYFQGRPYSELPVVRAREKLFIELSNHHESFGGVWMDPADQEHIFLGVSHHVNEANNRELILTHFKTIIKESLALPDIPELENIPPPDYRFTIKNVEYAFNELQYIRDLITPALPQVEETKFSHIDMKKNRFVIGISKGAGQSKYTALAEAYDIPLEAILIEELEPTTVNFENELKISSETIQSNHTIRDYYRPLTGGFKIERSDGLPCTMGFNIKLDNQDIWVTASNCSDQFGSTGNTEFHQPDAGGGLGTLIGEEFRDKSTSPLNQRYSNAVFVETKYGGNPPNFGRFARTKNFSSNWGSNGSIVLETNPPPYNPPPQYYTIRWAVEDVGQIMQGMELRKVGQQTGYTSGNVTVPCSDLFSPSGIPSNTWLLCQVRATTYAAPGDRGAPAFYQIPAFAPFAALYGIYAGSLGTYDTFYSPISGIKEDLVNMGETFEINPY